MIPTAVIKTAMIKTVGPAPRTAAPDTQAPDAQAPDAQATTVQRVTSPAAPARGAVPSRPGRADIGSGVQDISERAERSRRDKPARSLDESMTRFTAAHTGVGLAPVEADPEPAARRLPRPNLVQLVALSVAVVVVAGTAFGAAAKSWLGSAVQEVSALDQGSGAVLDAAAQQGDQNVLHVATDSAAAADTVVVAHVPAGGDGVVALALPPDLEVNRPPCDRFDPDTATYTGETVPAEVGAQLRSAWEVGGPRCATRVVQQLTGLEITAYIGTDLDGIGAAVDAVSGIGVCVTRPVRDAVLGPVVPDAGDNTLDGGRAADFVRAAEVETDLTSSYGRVERQHQVLAGVLNGALSGTGLLDVGQLGAVRSALAGSVVADGAGLDEILAVALSLQRLDAPGVTFATVPTEPEVNGRGNLTIRDADATALFQAVRGDTELPEVAIDPLTAQAGPVPSDVTVQVINGSDRAGLAAEVGTTLGALGFGIGEPGSAEQPTPQTVIRFSPDQAAAAELLAATVPSATSAPDPGSTGVLQLVLGRGFDDVLRAPTEPVTLAAPATGPEVPPVEC